MRTKKALAAKFLREAAAHCEMLEEGLTPFCHGAMYLDLDETYGEIASWDGLTFGETRQAIIFALVWGAEMLLRKEMLSHRRRK